jgi:hypothetical protein
VFVNHLSTLHPLLRIGKIIVILALLAVLLVPQSGFAVVTFNPGFNPGVGKGSAAECTRTISSGSIENAADGLGNGQVLCVRDGVYTEGDQKLQLRTSGASGAPKKIKAYPGERVEFRGALEGEGSHWIIEGLFVDASYSPVNPAPGGGANTDQAIKWTKGTNIRFNSVELINRRPNRDPDLAGTCVYFGPGKPPTNITIKNSSIHHCGQLPRKLTSEHCVSAGLSSGLRLRNNRVYACADLSIFLGSDTHKALVVGNLVDSNPQGGTQGGIKLEGSVDNARVRNNVVDTPNGTAIYTSHHYSGSGNVVFDNCVWDTHVNLAANVTHRSNILANPQISGHTVTNSRCAEKLPADSPFRP